MLAGQAGNPNPPTACPHTPLSCLREGCEWVGTNPRAAWPAGRRAASGLYLQCCGCLCATVPGGSSSLELSLGTSSRTCCCTVSTGPTLINTSSGFPGCPCIKNKQTKRVVSITTTKQHKVQALWHPDGSPLSSLWNTIQP